MSGSRAVDPRARTALRAGITGGGLTAGFTVVVWLVCLLLRGAAVHGAFLDNLADLAWSILVLGALASVCNYVVAFVRARIYYPGTGVNAMGRTATGSTAGWAALTGLFLALTVPVVGYVLLAFWLTAAMTIAFCLLLVCLPAGIVFALLARPIVGR